VILDDNQLSESWFKPEIINALGHVEIEWASSAGADSYSGILAIHFSTPTGNLILD
jgi:hypothetical protein